MTATITITDKPNSEGDVAFQLSFNREGKTTVEIEKSPAIRLAVNALEWLTEQRDKGTPILGLRYSVGKAKASKKRKEAA